MRFPRVVITGLGCVTPYGVGTNALWAGLCSGKSAVSALPEQLQLTKFNVPVHIAATIPSDVDKNADAFVPANHFSSSELRRTHRFVQLAIVAANQALLDANLSPESMSPETKQSTGVSVGSGVGSLEDIIDTSNLLASGEARKVSPFFVPRMLINMPAGEIAIRHGFGGPNHAAVTACATGAHSIGDGMRFIQHGQAKIMVVGGTDACVHPVALVGFHRLKSLSTQTASDASLASRPWDCARDGFVMGEGAGVLVLEEREHALERGARIYAELAGYGASGDGHHVTAPLPDGSGAARAMQFALKEANVTREQLASVNAHATSTPIGDIAELRAIKRAFEETWGTGSLEGIAITSNKGGIGHLLGAAGAVEAIACILGLHQNKVPPCINLNDIDPDARDCGAIFPRETLAMEQPVALSNSFGFGGTNAALVFKRHSQ